MNNVQYIKISENSRIPKYKQIVESVIKDIRIGSLSINEKMPSIREYCDESNYSKRTVEKAYNILKKRKIITSIPGKGFYNTRTKLISKKNILFLVNKMSSYKLQIYNSFVQSIGLNVHTDLHFYHCNESLFLKLLEKNSSVYDYYVVMTHFKTSDLKYLSSTIAVEKAIKEIPKEKLVLIDNVGLGMDGKAVEIYQDFEEDLYNSLKDAIEKITKYKKIFLVYPETSMYPYPIGILNGFKKFCNDFSLNFEIINEVYDHMILKKGDLFIVIEELDLINLINLIKEDEMVLGSDIGVISYNETPLKDLLGITTISTDFKKMGETAANMISINQKGQVKIPFNFIHRQSI